MNFPMLFATACLLLSAAACKKAVTPVLPGDKEGIALNFYPASDVMQKAASSHFTAIDVDWFVTNPVFAFEGTGKDTSVPFFYFSYNGIDYEYPGVSNDVMTFVRYNAGSHRLRFTDTGNVVVLDTTINTPASSFTCVYFADKLTANGAPPAYTTAAVQEDRRAPPPGQVGVRFVHLSADAGTLVCSRRKTDGTLTNALPADLHFCEASPYEYFQAADTVAGLLQFSLDNPANGASVITGVPFQPGRKYVVAVIGFFNDQQRQIVKAKDPDGAPVYKQIFIPANLRGTTRISY